MGIKDLMIGDYVRYNTKFGIGRISNILHNNTVDIETGKGTITDVRDENISPIDLTADILENSGFRLNYVSSEWSKDNLVVFGEQPPFFVSNIRIEFVHELQNIARICSCDIKDLVFKNEKPEFKRDERVLVRKSRYDEWELCTFYKKEGPLYYAYDLKSSYQNSVAYKMCIPYNEKTFMLIGTTVSSSKIKTYGNS